MKKTSTKLFLAAATLGLAAASTIGSTYAWFTINGEAKVENISMTVDSGAGISFRKHTTAGNGDYSIKYDATADFTSKTWTAVTPKAKTAGAKQDFAAFQQVDVAATIAAKASKAYVMNTTDITSTTTGANYFYALDLDVRVSDGYDIKIAATIKDGTTPSTGNDICRAAYALRIGLVTYASDDSTINSSKTYRLITSKMVNDIATTAFNESYGLEVAANAIDVAVGDTLESSKNVKITPQGTATGGYKVQRVSLFVWYEGTDYACANTIFSQTVEFGIDFTPVKQ